MSARAAPSPLAALAALVLLSLAATLPSGPPPDALGRRAWDGLGPKVDARLPGGGWLVHERVLRSGSREWKLEVRSRLGHELVVCALYAAWVPLGVLVLRRRGGVPPLRPRARDLDALLTALAALVPLYAVAAVVAVLASRSGGGGALSAAVHGWSLPALASPATAVWPLLRFLVLAPLAEELLWRGLVFRGLRGALPLVPAAVATGLAFASWHWLSGWTGLGPLVAQYLFGFAACLLVERTGGLAAPILLHALGNAATVGLYFVCMYRAEHLIGMLGG